MIFLILSTMTTASNPPIPNKDTAPAGNISTSLAALSLNPTLQQIPPDPDTNLMTPTVTEQVDPLTAIQDPLFAPPTHTPVRTDSTMAKRLLEVGKKITSPFFFGMKSPTPEITFHEATSEDQISPLCTSQTSISATLVTTATNTAMTHTMP